MPRPEELRLTEYGSEDSDYDEDIFNNSIIHSYEKKVCLNIVSNKLVVVVSLIYPILVEKYF